MLAKQLLGILTLFLCLGTVTGSPQRNDVILLLETQDNVTTGHTTRINQTIAYLAGRLSIGSQLSLIAFNDKAHLLLPFLEITHDIKPKLLASTVKLPLRSSGIDTASALERAIYELRANGQPDATRSIIILGDALMDTGDPQLNIELSRWMRQELVTESNQAGIRIYWLTYSESADYRVIQSVTRNTGGNYFRVFDSKEQTAALESLGMILQPSTRSPLTDEGFPASNISIPSSESKFAVWFWKQPISEMMTKPLFLISIASLTLLVVISALTLRRKHASNKRSSHSVTNPDTSRATLRDASQFTGMAEYDITGKRTFIGRIPREVTTSSCIIVINDQSIGRNHATIEYQNHGYWVHDSGTVNGTYINEERVHQTIQLKNGDKLRFGRFEFDIVLPHATDFESASKHGYTHTITTQQTQTPTIRLPDEDDGTLLRPNHNPHQSRKSSR